MTDIEIASRAKLLPITDIAAKLGIPDDDLWLYGKYKAKVTAKRDKTVKSKLILVTAINPTPYGEGKTTVSIGLADAFTVCGKKAALALREPSLGPVFGIKGGATGGGYSQVVPMDDINLHFNGDFHAITSANNLLSALIDNHIKQGNELGISEVTHKRTMDMNDRALREIECALGGPVNGTPRKDGFNITAACEIMAVLCLAEDIKDLKRRLAGIIIGYDKNGKVLTAGDLKAQDAMTILLKDALLPNLVQTLAGTPAFIHGGPFANIAHGCNSITATRTALHYADYVVTEAGFGAELGAEKFLDIKCRKSGLEPDAVVLVVTARALKYNGGADKNSVNNPDLDALKKGICNMTGHIRNLKKYNKPVIVAINRFITDTVEELDFIRKTAAEEGADAVIADAWAQGGKGCVELCRLVAEAAKEPRPLRLLYDDSASAKEKIEKVAAEIYGAGKVIFSDEALKTLNAIKDTPYGSMPVCIAKTQYSFSQDPKLLGRPEGFDFTVREIQLRGGAEFLVAICGDIMLMPGLPKVPNAVNMTIDENLNITGLF